MLFNLKKLIGPRYSLVWIIWTTLMLLVSDFIRTHKIAIIRSQNSVLILNKFGGLDSTVVLGARR